MSNSSELAVKDVPYFNKVGALTKKDVFKWNVQATLAQKGEARSDMFSFGPARNSKFYLLLTMDPEKSEFLHNQFGVCLGRTLINSAAEDIAVKVSFALLDTRDRLHYACERIMRDSDRVYSTFDNNVLEKHQQIFIRKGGIVSIHCAMDVEELLQEDAQNVEEMRQVKTHGDDSDSAKDLVDSFKCLLEQEKFCDVTLCVRDKEFQTHRAILCARSPVFAAMFEHDTLEKKQNRVIIDDIDSEIMQHLLRFVYTGDTDQLTPSVSLSLLAAADKYELPKLKKKCSCFLSSNLTTDMALGVLAVANMHQDETLKNAAIQIVLDNAVQVMKTDDWLAFLREYSELANSIILRLAMGKLKLHA